MQWLSGKPLENARLNFKKAPEFRKIRQIFRRFGCSNLRGEGSGQMCIAQFLHGSTRTPAGGLIEPVVIELSITERVTV